MGKPIELNRFVCYFMQALLHLGDSMVRKQYFALVALLVLSIFLFKATRVPDVLRFGMEHHIASGNLYGGSYQHHRCVNHVQKCTPMQVLQATTSLIPLIHIFISPLPITSHALFLPPLILRL